MNIDTGMAVLILAVLVFYLRLIVLQRERAKRAASIPKPVGKKSSRARSSASPASPRYTLLSQNPMDLAIAGVGLLAILIGVILNLKWIDFPAIQNYWWIPTAAGIVAFSWAFKL